jgi:hypothetical protein
VQNVIGREWIRTEFRLYFRTVFSGSLGPGLSWHYPIGLQQATGNFPGANGNYVHNFAVALDRRDSTARLNSLVRLAQ